ncbi:hypothetical protein ACFPN2_21020 [Steroidobacter flavus]|uniref:RNA polymerase sigma-70 region 2 domain-containing protein n=1 Tax=Steroidobacter flavus TaxID=1842136 RepID=A0ABV8SYR2_9GAMM
MPDARDTLDDWVNWLEPAYASFRDFLLLRTGDATRAGDLLRDALLTTLSTNADTPISLVEFSRAVLKAALSSLRHRDEAARTQATHARLDVPAVLAGSRALLRSAADVDALVRSVIDSFARICQRELVRAAWSEAFARGTSLLEDALPRDALVHLLLRAHRRLVLAMHQQELARLGLETDSILSTTVDIARWTLRRRIEQIVINSGANRFEVDAWFADWLHAPDAALDDLRPDECLSTRAGRERFTDEYLRHLIHREQDRLQLQRLFVEATADEPLLPADAAYFEELRRYAKRE